MREGRIYRVKVAIIERDKNGAVGTNRKEWDVAALENTEQAEDARYVLCKAGVEVPEGVAVDITKYRHSDMISIHCTYGCTEVIASISAYDLRKVKHETRKGLKHYAQKVSKNDMRSIINQFKGNNELRIKKVNNRR